MSNLTGEVPPRITRKEKSLRIHMRILCMAFFAQNTFLVAMTPSEHNQTNDVPSQSRTPANDSFNFVSHFSEGIQEAVNGAVASTPVFNEAETLMLEDGELLRCDFSSDLSFNINEYQDAEIPTGVGLGSTPNFNTCINPPPLHAQNVNANAVWPYSEPYQGYGYSGHESAVASDLGVPNLLFELKNSQAIQVDE